VDYHDRRPRRASSAGAYINEDVTEGPG
jgi:hypothetical protein